MIEIQLVHVHQVQVRATRWQWSTQKFTGLPVIVPDSFKLSRRGEGGLGGWKRGDSAGKTSGWSVAVSSVGKGLAHSLGDVLGADAEDIQQLLRFPTAGDATHCKPGHNNARLLAHC